MSGARPHPDPLRTSVSREGARVVVAIHGEVGIATAAQLDDELQRWARDEEVAILVLDMTGIVFMDSSILRVLVAAEDTMSQRGARFGVKVVEIPVRRMLAMTRLDRLEWRDDEL